MGQVQDGSKRLGYAKTDWNSLGMDWNGLETDPEWARTVSERAGSVSNWADTILKWAGTVSERGCVSQIRTRTGLERQERAGTTSADGNGLGLDGYERFRNGQSGTVSERAGIDWNCIGTGWYGLELYRSGLDEHETSFNGIGTREGSYNIPQQSARNMLEWVDTVCYSLEWTATRSHETGWNEIGTS